MKGLWVLGKKALLLFVGFFVLALASVLLKQANIGLGPWDALHDGISRQTPLTYGQASIAVGLAIVAVDFLCKERLGWTKSTTYTVLRKLCQKGAAKNENAQVTPLLTRTQAIQAQSEELLSRAGNLPLLFTAFLSGRKLTLQEAEELKRLIDESQEGKV